MPGAEKVFWGIAIAAGIYLLIGGGFSLPGRVNAQLARTETTAAQPSSAGGHYMPNGQWMAGGMGGMACGAKGGGCGCGGGRKINNPQ